MLTPDWEHARAAINPFETILDSLSSPANHQQTPPQPVDHAHSMIGDCNYCSSIRKLWFYETHRRIQAGCNRPSSRQAPSETKDHSSEDSFSTCSIRLSNVNNSPRDPRLVTRRLIMEAGYGDGVPDLVKRFVVYFYRHIRWAS